MELTKTEKWGWGIGIVITLGALLLVYGYNYWGWFGGSTEGNVGSDGFPANPKDGDKYTKDGKVYVFKKMEINCITTPCPDGMWLIFNEGDSPENISPSDNTEKKQESSEAHKSITVQNQKWSFDSIQSYNNGNVLFVGQSKISDKFMAGQNIIVHITSPYIQNRPAQIKEIITTFPSVKNTTLHKIVVKFTTGEPLHNNSKGEITSV